MSCLSKRAGWRVYRHVSHGAGCTTRATLGRGGGQSSCTYRHVLSSQGCAAGIVAPRDVPVARAALCVFCMCVASCFAVRLTYVDACGPSDVLGSLTHRMQCGELDPRSSSANTTARAQLNRKSVEAGAGCHGASVKHASHSVAGVTFRPYARDTPSNIPV